MNTNNMVKEKIYEKITINKFENLNLHNLNYTLSRNDPNIIVNTYDNFINLQNKYISDMNNLILNSNFYNNINNN